MSLTKEDLIRFREDWMISGMPLGKLIKDETLPEPSSVSATDILRIPRPTVIEVRNFYSLLLNFSAIMLDMKPQEITPRHLFEYLIRQVEEKEKAEGE